MKTVDQHIDVKCFHCGDDCTNQTIRLQGKKFCCNGCKTVYEILNQNGLCDYYDLNSHPGVKQSNNFREGKFDFLTNSAIAAQLIKFHNGKETHVGFYLPQIHCSSCLWLLENIDTINEHIISSKVNFITKEVFIVFDAEATTLKNIVETLTLVGYEPHLSLHELQVKQGVKLNRSRWYKIGVAGFCFSNIMMLSFPEYLLSEGTIEPSIAIYFKTLILLLSLPVLFYSASEFFISAYKSLQQKYLNIDAPVALALVITFGRSIYEIFSGTGNGYLDSMSGIVFFMLVGRWLQDRTYNLINFDRDFKSFFPIAVNVIKDGETKPTDVNLLKENDVIMIHSNEIIPVDSILSKGNAQIDYSFVNGENLPVNINKGELIYAGGKQLGTLLELVVVKPVSQSYLTNLWNKNIFKQQKKVKKTLVDVVGKYFTYIVLAIGLSASIFWYAHSQVHLMWNALTTILIVACPCALLLSENFTYSNFLRILGQNKFYIKNKTTLENIIDVDTIVFDKTGTLTHSNSSLVKYIGKALTYKQEKHIAALLSQSMHTLTSPILEYLDIKDIDSINDFKEVEGKGIEGWIDDVYIKIGSAFFVGQLQEELKSSEVFIQMDNEVIGKFTIGNTYRVGVFEMIALIQQKYKVSLLSGDNNAELPRLQKIFSNQEEIYFNQKPEDKLNYIEDLQQKGKNVAMIGDGLNDAGALKQSDVGIAITDKNNVFSPASDAIMQASSLHHLYSFFKFIKSSKVIIFTTFVISALYNIIGLYYAVQGVLSPLIAAILMPCSSITIVCITYLMTNYFAKKHKLITT